MGTFRRSARDWANGWQPSIDLINGPESALPFAKNVHLDELGALALRRGAALSVPGYTSPLPGGELRVNNIYVAVLNSSPTTLAVKRVVGADYGFKPNPCSSTNVNRGSIYINGARRDSCIVGSGDIAIHHGFGQVFWTRSTRHRKNDGSESGGEDGRGTRNWGIAKPSAKATFGVSAPDGATFASCDAGEVPAFEADDGTLTFVEGNDATAEGAILLAANPDTGVAAATRYFGADNPQDFTRYDGGDTGIDEDIIQGYIRCTNPENLASVTFMFDVNGDSATPFQDDYYWYEMAPDQVVGAKPGTLLGTADVNVDPAVRERINARTRSKQEQLGIYDDAEVDQPSFQIRRDAGWARFAIPRKSFLRNGGAAGRGWNTVVGVRVVVVSNSADLNFGELSLDNITISGGANHPFTGTYTCRYLWAHDFGNYIALSPPSDASNPVTTQTNGLTVQIPASAVDARDSQADEVWVYLFGGALNGFYRVATKAIEGTALNIDVSIREADAVKTNLVLNLNLTVPPNDIISIAGPHYGRLLALTPYGVSLSQENNPDTFSTDEIIKIGDGGEVPYWMIVSDARILVGTSRTIWEISGTLVRLPDGTIDARKVSLEVPGPNDHAVAVDGPIIAYVAADGPRLLSGGVSRRIVGGLDLLMRGQDRYGVSALNLGLAPGRTRVAIADKYLYMIAPEGAYEEGSPVVYRYDLGADRWWRFVYPGTMRTLHREPSNALLAGDDAGRVWQLESGTTDSGAAITGEFWTVSEAPGSPLIRKDYHDVLVNMDSGSSASTVDVHVDQAATATLSMSAVVTPEAPLHQAEAAVLNRTRRAQLRTAISSTTGAHFYDWSLNFRERPIARVRWDTGFPALVGQIGSELVWFRRMNITANAPTDLLVRIYFAGTLDSSYTITVTPNETDVYWIPIGRECKGRQPLVVVTPAAGGGEEAAFELYRLGFKVRTTGEASEMQYVEFNPES